MARCPLCESDVPDGRTDCDACGQPFAKPPTTRVAPDAVRKAIESARKDLAVSPRDPVDVAFPRGLLERAEQTEAAGDLGRALDLARASRRALDIIRRESRVADALKYADAVLEDAKQAGIETLAFQRNIEQARALAARGDHGTAERLLRRVSVRTLDQRRERILAASVEKAESRVRYALERGGNVGDAAALLADARKALALKEYNKVRSLSAKAIEKADSQRKYARAETILDRASADVDVSRRDGVNITEARKLLTQAQDALRKGVYADIPLLAQKARNSLREARAHAAAEVALRASDREAAREKRKGADVGRADTILAQGAEALEAKEYAKVRGFAKDAHEAVREAALLKTVRQAFASLQPDADDIRTMGAEGTTLSRCGKRARRTRSRSRGSSPMPRSRCRKADTSSPTRSWTASSMTSPRPASRSEARPPRSSDRPAAKSPARERTASRSTPRTGCSRTPRPRIPRPAMATRSTRGRRASPRSRSWPGRTRTRSDSPSRRRSGSSSNAWKGSTAAWKSCGQIGRAHV